MRRFTTYHNVQAGILPLDNEHWFYYNIRTLELEHPNCHSREGGIHGMGRVEKRDWHAFEHWCRGDLPVARHVGLASRDLFHFPFPPRPENERKKRVVPVDTLIYEKTIEQFR